MFGWFRRKPAPKKLVDPVFGELTFAGSWQGSVWFAPVKESILLEVVAGEDGPTESEREFFRQLLDRYPKLWLKVRSNLEREYDLQVDGDEEASYPVTFGLDSLHLPANPEEEWNLGCSCSDGDDWLFTVHLKGWEPTGQISVMH